MVSLLGESNGWAYILCFGTVVIGIVALVVIAVTSMQARSAAGTPNYVTLPPNYVSLPSAYVKERAF